jgi:hypothetical protein
MRRPPRSAVSGDLGLRYTPWHVWESTIGGHRLPRR